MTKELNDDIKLHLEWLTKTIEGQGYQLKEVIDLMKNHLTDVRANIIVEMHKDKIRPVDIAKRTGFNNSLICSTITHYWKSKKIGFKEETKTEQQ